MPPRASPSSEAAAPGLLTIGALSSATGIPIDTIRTWERRYGFPVPQRKPSGHRVYHLATVPRLRRAAQAIAQGHRAAEVVPASESALEALIGSLPRSRLSKLPAARPSAPESRRLEQTLAQVFPEVRTFDGEALKRRLDSEWVRLGPLEFLEYVSAVLTAIGNAWARGELDVRHEHFASGVLGDFLRRVRSPLEDRATGPLVTLATLPNELHGLGLQMAALVFALAGWRPLLLGVDTPPAQIASLIREVPLAAVALSCVQPPGRRGLIALRALRRRLPRQIPILLGGHGAAPRHSFKGVEWIPDLVALDRWVRQHQA